jgi:alkaline phosphatase D
MRRVSRRNFLGTTSLVLGALPLVRGVAAGQEVDGGSVFRHGVASGDPLTDRVLLWTRVSVEGCESVRVRWIVATDPRLSRVVARGEGETGGARDFTVKVDVTGLEPGTTYYYAFESGKARSPIGRTRTLPLAGVSRVRLGVVSCANYPSGYFNVYQALARRADLDAVLHLGDYIYEYGNRPTVDGRRFGRVPQPDAEIVALADYRARHAQHKADPDAQDVHRQHPFIVVWDDHEFANNAWSGGAQNHNPDAGEGEWTVRRDAAIRAFFEWMPIREDAPSEVSRIYRRLRFGGLADLIMLDTRVVGRDLQVARDDIAALDSPARTILGAEQEAWLRGQLAGSKAAGTVWQVLGQQVMFAPQSQPGQPGGNVDSWDGYRHARERVFDMVEESKVENFAVLTGDVHSAWAYDLPRRPFDGYDPGTGRGSRGVELVVTSITSSSTVGSGPDGEQQLAGFRKRRPHLHYVDGRYRGYFVLDLTRERLQADYFAMKTIEDRTAEERFVKGFAAPAGQMHLTEQATPARAQTSADPAP